MTKIEPKIGIEIDNKIYNYKLFQSLDSLTKTYSQRKTAKELGISHSVLNRRIKNAETNLGYQLVEKIGSGSELTSKGLELLDIYHKYVNRLKNSSSITIAGGHIVTGLLESLSYDIPFELSIFSSDDINAYKLAKNDLIDILALDDPLLAFENNLNFTPIAYDYLVLISNNKNPKKIESLEDLKDMEFVSVKGTAQRLAYNTLKTKNIQFKINREVKSQFDAYKIVKRSDNLYTFLNASFFNGNEILKKETMHALSLIYSTKEKEEVNEFIEYILSKCQDKIKKQGFIPLNPGKYN